MSGGAKKAAPREKVTQFADTRYEVLAPSFINGAIQPVGAFVYLPKGVTAGSNLRAVGKNAESDDEPINNVDAFLGRTVPEVINELADASDDDLKAYANAEKGDKGRVGVLEAIKREQDARKAAQ